MFKKKGFMLSALAILLILISFFYAFSLIPTHTVFYYDQARDAYEAYSIWHDHNIKILGPSSDIPGINHGVLWYYFLAVIYALGQGIPENALTILLVGLYAFIPLLWYLTKKMSQSTTVAAVSTALYAMAPLYISFALWLSNPVLALFITPPLFYFLWKYIHKKSLLTAALIGFFFGLLIQSDFGFIVILFILPIYHFAFKQTFILKNTLALIGGLIIGLLPFFVTYIKFKTNVIAIIADFVFGKGAHEIQVGQTVVSLIDHGMKLLSLTYLPLPALLGFFIVLSVLIVFRKTLFTKTDELTKLSLIWLTGILFIFIFNKGNLLILFFYAPFLYPLAILFAIFLTKLIKDVRVLAAVLLIISTIQFLSVHSLMSNQNSPLSIQKGMTTYYERQVLEYVYQSAAKEPFAIATVTNPLYINTTWSYLFETYGKPKYDYVPSYWGKDQAGYLSFLPMQKSLETTKVRYLIIEPPEGIDEYWIQHSVEEENLVSTMIEEKKFGNFIVQKRELRAPDQAPQE